MNEEILAPAAPATPALGETAVKPQEKEAFTRSEKLLSLVTAALGVAFTHFVLRHINGFFTTGFYAAALTVILAVLRREEKKLGGFHKAWAGVMYLFSTVFSLTANSFIKGLCNIFLVMGISYLVFAVRTGRNGFGRFMPLDMTDAVFSPVGKMSKGFSAAGSAVRESKTGGKLGGMALGLILAIPLTAVVGSLLMSADSGVAVFLGNVLALIDPDNIWTVIWELLIGLPVGGYIFAMLWQALHTNALNGPSQEDCDILCRRFRRLSVTALCTAVTPICLLYVIFFLSQANYFLSAFMGRLPADQTFALYARQGFFELFAIAVINSGVILGINFLARREDTSGKPRAIKIYTIVLALFTIIMCAIGLSKMFLYIDNFGLTQLRIYTSWFMALTALIFVYVIIKQLRPGFGAMNAAAWTFTVMFAILCFSRPDALLARFNLEYRADRINAYDIAEMTALSEDSAAVVLEEKYKVLIGSKLADYGKTRQELEDTAQRMLDADSFAAYSLPSQILISELGS